MPHELSDDAIRAVPDPLQWFNWWYEEQRSPAAGAPWNAMTLATTDADGAPDARVVLLAQWDEAGFVFMTNYESPKGDQIAAVPQAALVFHWPELGRQIRIRGPVAPTGPALSDAYFGSRPRSSQLGAWTSEQSRILIGGKAELDQRMAELGAQYAGDDVPRPPHWGGYRVTPRSLELWQTAPARLHLRYRFTRSGAGEPWEYVRLQP